ncbi:MAG: hypothetical protein IJE18_07155 [Bacteroidaceae bacterium]|nr:hypothetical protein [Bacteroidaceae bacterium]
MEKEKETMPAETMPENITEMPPAEESVPVEVSSRDRIVERLRANNPEGVYDTDDALYAGVEGMMTERDSERETMNGKLNELSEVFKRSPQAASFFIDMMEGKGLYESLGRNFGDDLMTAINGDDAVRAEFDKGLAEWQNEATARREREEAFKSNSDAAMSEYEAWLAEQGYSPEDREELERDILAVSEAMNGGKFMDFIKALHRSRRYDSDIENARAEGEIRGRNARIAEERTLPKSGGDGLPSMQGLSRPDDVPVKPSKWTEDMFWGE